MSENNIPLGTALNPESRRRKIMEYVVREGTTRIEDLADLLGVSAMTAYRDVAQLEKSRLVTRRRGEISAAESSLVEVAAKLRMGKNSAAKNALVAALKHHLHPGQAVFLDDSTSNIPLVLDLSSLAPLTVITNAEFIARLIRPQSEVKLLVTGGEYEPWADSYCGYLTEQSIKLLRADLCIMSATALDQNYCFHPMENITRIKQAMLAMSKKKILLADGSKFNRTALHVVTELSNFDLLITDQYAPKDTLVKLEKQGVEIEVVQVKE